ncbi:EAL domain-containing protein, partial [Aquisalimonas sp.]|uniref:EAL domain-containing protein n=1 Tax=Aquisalimonas sp. TaxID=1872621 RepID=UPI0025C1058F
MSNQVRQVHSAEHERLRIQELLSMDVLDTRQEERFDRYTRLVAEIFDVPVALISLVDTHRQWFKSRVGVEKEETPREHSICAHAIAARYLEVRDLLADPKFRDNPDVTGPPYYRFYAGAVLFGPTGQPLGTLCILHFEPRALGSTQKQWLMAFARLVQEEMAHSIELEETKTRVQEMMLRDPLTGLPNEPLFLEILENLIHHNSHGHQSLAVGHLLLKNLDDLVELHGKDTAEAFLRSLGQELAREDGVTVAVGRLSHKRLAIVKDLDSAQQLLGRAAPRIAELNQATPINGTWVHPEIVAGFSVFPVDATSAATLLDRARMALAETQSAPGIHLYRSGAHAEASRRFRIREALSSALDHDELTLYYQPMFSADGRRLIGFEALARWLDGPEGTISPAEFIPIAEESEVLARKLTRFVLRQACWEASSWKTDNAGRAIQVAVNISANEFRQIDFIALVQSVLAETGIEPQQLTLELT